MGQYFDNDKSLKEDIHLITFYFNKKEYQFYSESGVFSKSTLDYGSKVLLESLLKENLKGEGNDLGCGIGVIGCLLMINNKDVIIDMEDINERAVNLANMNAEKYHLSKSNIILSNILESVEKTYDFIVTNPPIRAGKKVIYSFYQQAYDHLRKSGCFYVVIQKKQGAESSINEIERIFGNCEVINKDKGYFILKALKI